VSGGRRARHFSITVNATGGELVTPGRRRCDFTGRRARHGGGGRTGRRSAGLADAAAVELSDRDFSSAFLLPVRPRPAAVTLAGRLGRLGTGQRPEFQIDPS
jgi:hypothetical protein